MSYFTKKYEWFSQVSILPMEKVTLVLQFYSLKCPVVEIIAAMNSFCKEYWYFKKKKDP